MPTRRRPPAKDGKRWPTFEDLQAWKLFHELDSVESANVTPLLLRQLLMNIRKESAIVLHREMYREYEDFRKSFHHPDQPC